MNIYNGSDRPLVVHDTDWMEYVLLCHRTPKQAGHRQQAVSMPSRFIAERAIGFHVRNHGSEVLFDVTFIPESDRKRVLASHTLQQLLLVQHTIITPHEALMESVCRYIEETQRLRDEAESRATPVPSVYAPDPQASKFADDLVYETVADTMLAIKKAEEEQEKKTKKKKEKAVDDLPAPVELSDSDLLSDALELFDIPPVVVRRS